MIALYAGFDPREEVGFHTFTSSVIHNASEPVAIVPLHMAGLRNTYSGGERDGTNAFIYTRFLIPCLQGYRGWAIFVDGCDMVCRGDIAELWALREDRYAVQVAQHYYRTKHARKYVGTTMEAGNEDYPRKNWSSVMLINCGHPAWHEMGPGEVAGMTGAELHRFSWIPPQCVGSIPFVWNWLADEYGENPQAKLLHWTAGIPAWPAYRDAPMADAWREAHGKVNFAA